MSDQSQHDPGFEAVLDHLKEARHFDFTGYKRASLQRRVQRRMARVGIDDYAEYIDHLEVNPDEFVSLFNTILINVTGFFRDNEAWQYLREEIVPKMLSDRGRGEPIRIWSAGCASGEEAYSLAIVLAEALGDDEFRRHVKIYATDVDDHALTQARSASYGPDEIGGLSEAHLARYFERQGERYIFRGDLRRSVIFGRNDLVQDAPISRLNLLVCRNTLMYFTSETQQKILGRFHFALAPKGLLFLGKAEMLLGRGRSFDPIDLKSRVFRKVGRTPSGFSLPAAEYAVQDSRADLGGIDELRARAFSTSPVAQVVLNHDDVLVLVNQQAETLFGVSSHDVGRPLRDLRLSYRPVELRAQVDQVRVERRQVRIHDVEGRHDGEAAWFEVSLDPLIGPGNALLGVSIVFHDVTTARQLTAELGLANEQLEAAYEELQSTNEELETTNEELQSTVEELETTNEELQSTNEELETINEELQSANDQLQSVNDPLRQENNALDADAKFYQSVFVSLKLGLVVVDENLLVRVWSRGAEDLWGLRAEETVGQSLPGLDIGLPLADIEPRIRQATTDDDTHFVTTLEAVTRLGRSATVKLACTPFRDSTAEPGRGAILVMEPVGAAQV